MCAARARDPERGTQGQAMTVQSDRIITLDVIRGVAVMGILLANLPPFALPEAGWFSPLAWGGDGPADRAVWFANYVLVEGKMRGLFTLLFGASMLLVIDRAEARGENPVAVHLRRMGVLFVLGCIHLYFFWVGDILSHYALVACFALLFVRLSVRGMIVCGVMATILQTLFYAMGGMALLASSARNTPEAIATWNDFANGFGVPARDILIHQIEAIRGGFFDAAAWRWRETSNPVEIVPLFGLETLGMMLLGMAGLRSGFLTGQWARARYWRWAAICFLVTMPFYVAMGWAVMAHGFDQRWVFFGSIVIPEPFRALMTIGYAALFVLMVGTGALTRRFAAVGRMALSNYLATTLIMTFIFSGWGLGQFGWWSRAQLYLLAPLVWPAMLLWSKPWLDRFAYGPFEWLWRSLARWQVQPWRRAAGQ